jgi:hypothetical protein
MRTPDQYREFAAQCYRLAAEAKTEVHQKMMEEMARAPRNNGFSFQVLRAFAVDPIRDVREGFQKSGRSRLRCLAAAWS